MQRFFTLASFAALASVASAQIQINELRIDQGGADNDEYFELSGPAGMPLDGLTYIVIGDGTTASGTIEAVVDLTGLAIAADGLFLGAESTFTIGTADDMTLSLNFENSDNVTHLVVSDFTGALADDLDTDDDGVLDVMPWTSVVTGIALVETVDPLVDGGDWYYANLQNVEAIGPDGTFVPGHVFRCDNGLRVGEFNTGAATETPGEPNFCPAVTEIFCAPAVGNSVSTDGSTLELVSASGGSIAANDSMLVVTNTPDDMGVFAQSMSTMAPVALTAGGNLCLGYPDIQRLGMPVMASGNTASLTLDFVSGGPEVMTLAGDTVYYQWYHRDGAGASNLSEGLAITWID